jgi:hypothetical protein
MIVLNKEMETIAETMEYGDFADFAEEYADIKKAVTAYNVKQRTLSTNKYLTIQAITERTYIVQRVYMNWRSRLKKPQEVILHKGHEYIGFRCMDQLDYYLQLAKKNHESITGIVKNKKTLHVLCRVVDNEITKV